MHFHVLSERQKKKNSRKDNYFLFKGVFLRLPGLPLLCHPHGLPELPPLRVEIQVKNNLSKHDIPKYLLINISLFFKLRCVVPACDERGEDSSFKVRKKNQEYIYMIVFPEYRFP